MANSKLVGRDDVAATTTTTLNYVTHTRFQAVTSGTVLSIKVRAGGSGNSKFAIYADNAGEPGALLNSVGSTPITAGVNTIPFPLTNIVAGTYYWITHNSDATIINGKTEAGARRYKAWAFANAFPNPAGAGYTADPTVNDIVAGWGDPSTNFFQLF